MRQAMVGAVAATTLLLLWAGTATAQTAPEKKPAPGAPAKTPTSEEKKAPAPADAKKAPPAPPSAPGKPWTQWDRATGDWFGQRTKLEDKGVSIDARYTNEYTRLQTGGLKSHNDADRYWLDVHVGFDLKKLSKDKVPGALHASYWQMGGENGTADTGSFDPISTIESDSRREFAELYYEDTYKGGRYRLRLGKMDPTDSFADTPHSRNFMNLGFSYAPDMFPMPRFPDSAVGGELHYKGDAAYMGIGVFDGSRQHGFSTGKLGASQLWGPPSDMFEIAELGYRWMDGERPVRAAVGGWIHTGDFPEFTGNTGNGNGNAYALVEGMLWKQARGDAKDGRGVWLVMRYAQLDEKVSFVERHLALAAEWIGPLASRKQDSVGVGWMHADLTDDRGSGVRTAAEQIVELYYRVQLTPFASIQPDASYIGNPGGMKSGDAVVLGLRFVLDF